MCRGWGCACVTLWGAAPRSRGRDVQRARAGPAPAAPPPAISGFDRTEPAGDTNRIQLRPLPEPLPHPRRSQLSPPLVPPRSPPHSPYPLPVPLAPTPQTLPPSGAPHSHPTAPTPLPVPLTPSLIEGEGSFGGSMQRGFQCPDVTGVTPPFLPGSREQVPLTGAWAPAGFHVEGDPGPQRGCSVVGIPTPRLQSLAPNPYTRAAPPPGRPWTQARSLGRRQE